MSQVKNDTPDCADVIVEDGGGLTNHGIENFRLEPGESRKLRITSKRIKISASTDGEHKEPILVREDVPNGPDIVIRLARSGKRLTLETFESVRV